MARFTDTNPVLQGALKAAQSSDAAEPRLQYADVYIKTAIMFTTVIVGAAVGWFVLPYSLLTVLAIGIATIVIVFIAVRQERPSAPLPLLYSILEGALIGSLSRLVAVQYGADVVVTALTATTIVFGVTLGVFQIPAVRNGSQGRRYFLIALLSYVVFSFVSLFAGVFFGVGGGWGFFGLGPISIAISIVGVLFASWSLLVDFGDVDRAVKAGYPEPQSWRLALGLTISTVWLYIEILRLFAILNGRN